MSSRSSQGPWVQTDLLFVFLLCCALRIYVGLQGHVEECECVWDTEGQHNPPTFSLYSFLTLMRSSGAKAVENENK